MELLTPPPDCQGLADVLRTELQALYRTLRFSRDRQQIRQAAERLQVALSNVEGSSLACVHPTRREAFRIAVQGGSDREDLLPHQATQLVRA